MAEGIELPSHFRDWNGSSDRSVRSTDKPAFQKPLWKRPLVIGVAVAFLIAIIIAIVVPLAVLLPKNGHKKHDASVLLPLYIYPQDNSTWSPLYDSLHAEPGLNFTVIINPKSGPGPTELPNDQYTAALTQLAKYPNVRKVGYVRTGYATRNLSDVIAEVNTYSGWSSKGSAFAMDGIFFDESPHEFSDDAVTFMMSASKAVKDAKGLQGSKTVIRNPGVIPDARFSDSNTDISVVFEESYAKYQTKVSELSALQDDRAHHCYMVHSIPSMDTKKFRSFVDDMSKRAEYLFVTTNSEEYYEKWGSDWSEFVNAVPS